MAKKRKANPSRGSRVYSYDPKYCAHFMTHVPIGEMVEALEGGSAGCEEVASAYADILKGLILQELQKIRLGVSVYTKHG